MTATAQRLGIGKSLAHDVLASLAGIGLLQRVGHGRYRLGWRTVTLASVLLRTSELKAHARPVVRDLAERQGLTVSLAAWDCGRIIYIDRRNSPRHTSGCGPVAGTAAPLDGSAAAKCCSRAGRARRSRRCGAMDWSTPGTRRSTSSSSISRWSGATAGRTTRRTRSSDSGAVAAPVRDADGNVAGRSSSTCSTVLDHERRSPRAGRRRRRVPDLSRDPPPRAGGLKPRATRSMPWPRTSR